MKSIFASVLLASLTAIAGPKVGDKIEMSIEYTSGPAARVGTGAIEITKIEEGKAHMIIELNFEGEERQTIEEDQDVTGLGYFEDLEALKSYCEQNSGEIGTAEVDGKTIDICTIIDGENTVKNAVVPFGLYEVYGKSDDATSHLKLLKFTVGQ